MKWNEELANRKFKSLDTYMELIITIINTEKYKIRGCPSIIVGIGKETENEGGRIKGQRQ